MHEVINPPMHMLSAPSEAPCAGWCSNQLMIEMTPASLHVMIVIATVVVIVIMPVAVITIVLAAMVSLTRLVIEIVHAV